MKILHVLLTRMPVPPLKYGGTERVVWALYKGQKELGHEVKFLTKHQSSHPDALVYNPKKTLEEQVEGWADIIHFHFLYEGDLRTPFICTTHNQQVTPASFPKNTVFLGKLHAERSGGKAYVYNGLYWGDYGEPNLTYSGNYIHFLANAKYKDKNLKDSVEVAQKAKKSLHIIGSKRYCLKWRKNGKYKPYFYPGNDLNFYGMLGGDKKNEVIRNSQALIFPVLNYEAFGLAMIESLYLGCPVIGSHCGSLPEIITRDVGISTDSKSVMVDALNNIGQFSRERCHDYARETFNHLIMSRNYLYYYEQVLNGHALHDEAPAVAQNLLYDFSLKD